MRLSCCHIDNDITNCNIGVNNRIYKDIYCKQDDGCAVTKSANYYSSSSPVCDHCLSNHYIDDNNYDDIIQKFVTCDNSGNVYQYKMYI